MTVPCHYVVLTAAGQVVTLSKGVGRDYFKLLLDLYDTWGFGGVGGASSRPAKLLCNGEIVIDSGLLTAASMYNSRRAQLIALAETQARNELRPPWMQPED